MELYKTSLISDANLLAYYRFNSGALTTDSKGSYTLTNNNSVGGSAAGKYGYCADFGSANTNKSLTDTGAFGLGKNKTVSFHVKLLAEGTSDQRFFYSYSKVDGRTPYVDYNHNSGNKRLIFSCDRVNAEVVNIYHTVTLGTTLWHHIALTYDGSIMRAYLDGVEVGNLSTSGNGDTSFYAVGSIGAAQSPINYALSSFASILVDDLAVFGRALTADEVALLAKQEPGGFFPFFM